MSTLKFTSLAILALLSQPLSAQETTAEPTEAPAEVEADATPADGSGLSLGTEIGGEPKVGDTYTAATFELWEQRCVKTESGIDPCQLYQLLKDSDGNAVAEFSLFNLPAGTEGPAVAGATFIAPLETLLTAGLTLQVDEGKARAYPFTFCAELGCVARIGFTAEEVAQFKAGGNAVLTIVPFVAPDQKVTLTASLKGFTAGFTAVEEANNAADAAGAAAAPAAP